MTKRLALLTSLIASSAIAQTQPQTFFIHSFHNQVLGALVCSLCHVPAARGSVEPKRPGHAECRVCHQNDFEKESRPLFCAQCHSGPRNKTDVLATGARLADFSHARHKDARARIDAATGLRSDCSFCHKFEGDGVHAKFPAHIECASCHSKPGVKPHLSASITQTECRGCHAPEHAEELPQPTVSSRYANIKFSHAEHLKLKNAYRLDCTTCHSAILASGSLADLTLPPMLECVACHDTSKKIAAQFRMSNCSVCHVDVVPGIAPPSHNAAVKPPSHNESFRLHHQDDASAPNAKCFACHQNVTPSLAAKNQCVGCHQMMKPASHTARWMDDIHGKFAALDRTNCATCHAADYCIRCHNELPRSHQPLPLFKAGAHAQLAMLNQRACMTCHTFQNTCKNCHLR
jgi:hypothetical protein